MADLIVGDLEEFKGRLIMMGAQVCCSALLTLFFAFLQHLVILLYLLVLQLFQRAVATSDRLKKHTTLTKESQPEDP